MNNYCLAICRKRTIFAVMIVNLAYLKRRFDEFNRLIFDSRLPLPRLRVSNSRSMLGCVRYKRQRGLLGKTTFSDFTLSISAFYDLNEETLDDVILHEMIHLDILSNHRIDDSAHGSLFRKKMNGINTLFGRHITISHRGKLEQAPKDKPVQNIIAVTELEDGTLGITRPSPSRVFDIYHNLPKYYKIRQTRWYNSRNPYFTLIPRSLKPKIYRVDRNTLDKELTGALELEFKTSKDGRQIIVSARIS